MASLMVWTYFGRPSYSEKPASPHKVPQAFESQKYELSSQALGYPPQEFPEDDLTTDNTSVTSECLIKPDSHKLDPKRIQAVRILMMSWVETNDAHATAKRAKPVIGRAKRIPCQMKDRVSLKKNKTPVHATV
jgi:hypothetical protein